MYTNNLISTAFLISAITFTPLIAKDSNPVKAPPVVTSPAVQTDKEGDNKKLVTNALELLYRGDIPAVSPLFNPNFTDNESAGDSIKGFGSMLLFSNTIRNAIPDLKFQIDEIQSIDDKVFVLGRLFGSYIGVYQGQVPSGKFVILKTADLFQIESNMIKTRSGVRDLSQLLNQSGFSTGILAPIPQVVGTSSSLTPGTNVPLASPATIAPATGVKKSVNTNKSKGSSTAPASEPEKKSNSK